MKNVLLRLSFVVRASFMESLIAIVMSSDMVLHASRNAYAGKSRSIYIIVLVSSYVDCIKLRGIEHLQMRAAF